MSQITQINPEALTTALEPLNTSLQDKQDKLVSGTNIKTINGTSLLGNGDISVNSPIYIVPMVTSEDGYPIPDSTNTDTTKVAAYITNGYAVIGKAKNSSAPVVSFISAHNGYHYHYYDENKGMMIIRVWGNNLEQHEIEYNYKVIAPQASGTTGVAGGVPVPTYEDKDKFLRGDGTWADIDSNCYYLSLSALSGQTAVTQTVLDAIVDVRNSNGKKHLYIYDENTTIGGVAEASVTNSWGAKFYYVSWFADYDNYRNNVWAYKIVSTSKKITDYSYQIRKGFSGATTSSSGKLGMVPAPTTADTESFLCGNGKWVKVTAGNSSFNIAPILMSQSSSGSAITEANYNSLKDAIQKGQPIYFIDSDSAQTYTIYASASILSGGTTAETISLFFNDFLTVGNWNPSEAHTSFETTYVPIQGTIYQIKKSDRIFDIGGYIYNQPMLSSGHNIKKINGQDLILSTADMTGNANLEISGSFSIDPNNYKFSELVQAVFAHKTIIINNFILFSYCTCLQAMPLDTDGGEATTTAETKSVYCTFMYVGSDSNKPYCGDTAIRFTGDNKWETIENAGGELMHVNNYTIDSSMSDSSTNPVQNKVIKAYIDGLVGNVVAQLAQI